MSRHAIKTKAECREALSQIEEELLKCIPRAIRGTKTPVYGLLVCWIDLTPADAVYTPALHLLPQAHLDECMSNGDVGYIWVLPEIQAATETIHVQTASKSSRVHGLCKRVYAFLTDGKPDQCESELLMPFRKMIYRVCRKLNAQDWSKVLPTSEHFTVVASDWSTGAYIEADAQGSVPAARRKKLEKVGLFFNPEAFSHKG